MIAEAKATPGHNPHTERRLVSACLAGGPGDVLAAAGEGLTAAAFADPTARMVWSALSTAVAQGQGAEIEAVHRILAGLDGSVEAATRIISEVIGLEPTSVWRRNLTTDVLDLARRRRLIAATASAAAEACSGSHREFDAVWEATEPYLRAAQESSAETRTRTLADIAAEAKGQLLKPDPRATVSTGLHAWDRQATPARAGQLVVIAARPGCGKSALAGQIAHHVATHEKPVAFFCLEMSAEEVVTRLARLRCYGRQPTNEALAAELDQLGKLDSLRLYEIEQAKTVEQIEATCRLMAASPRGLGAVVIDYLQLVRPPADVRRESREVQVAAMSRAFKLLARSLGAPVFLLAQLNRDVEKDDRPPRLSDLRESGAIEQDADRVWFIYTPKNATPAPSGASSVDVMLLQAKCRNGPSGVQAPLTFHRSAMAFTLRNSNPTSQY